MTSVLPTSSGIGESEWDDAVSLLLGAESVCVLAHVLPDGDALGGCVALAAALKSLGKDIVASWGSEPFVVPEAYATLPHLDVLSPPSAFPSSPDVVVTIDTGSLDRLGLLADSAARARALLVVDHHASNDGFGTHALLDQSAAASVVIVEELIRRLGVPVDRDLAALIYAGLTTDTGSFKYSATTPQVHQLAARLLSTGIRHDLIARAIWDSNSFGYVQMLGAALSRASLDREAAGGLGLAWTYTHPQELTTYGLRMDHLEGVIDVLRTTTEAEVAVVCKGDIDGTFRVSTRSKGRIDMSAICSALGGGGHRFAAGYTSDEDLASTMRRLRAMIDDAPHLPG